MIRRFLLVSGWAFVILRPAGARGAPPEGAHAVLDWRGPAACSVGGEIEREVERLLAGTTSGSPLEVHARVQRLASGRYQLVLETTDSKEARRFRRELAADSCEELIKPAAIIVALAIDPDAAQQALGSPPGGAEPGGETSAPRHDTQQASAPPLPPPEPTERMGTPTTESSSPERDRSRVASETAHRRPIVPFARAAGVLDVGVLPQAAAGVAAYLGLIGSKWRVEVGASYLLPRRAVLQRQPEKGGDIDLIAGALSGCFLPIRESIELGACAGVEAGSARGEGFGVDHPTEGSTGWLAVRAGGVAAYRFDPRLALELHAEAVARVGRASFTLEEYGPIHTPSPWGGRFDLGIRFSVE